MVISDSRVMTTLYKHILTEHTSLRSTVACADEQLSPIEVVASQSKGAG